MQNDGKCEFSTLDTRVLIVYNEFMKKLRKEVY